MTTPGFRNGLILRRYLKVRITTLQGTDLISLEV